MNGIGEERAWTQIEPSVSAFHLAFGPDDSLYVAGPTVTSFDSIWRINRDGQTDVFYRGLGRPQGLAFDREETCMLRLHFAGGVASFVFRPTA